MKFKFILIILIASLLAACSKTIVDPYKSYRKFSSRQIYEQGIHNLGKKHFEDATKSFEALNAVYPFGPFAEPGQVDLIYAYYKNGSYHRQRR